MTLRGFSNFEKMFRAKMATAVPVEVGAKKKKSDGLNQQEIADYRRVFNKFDKDQGGTIGRPLAMPGAGTRLRFVTTLSYRF